MGIEFVEAKHANIVFADYSLHPSGLSYTYSVRCVAYMYSTNAFCTLLCTCTCLLSSPISYPVGEMWT